MPCKFLIEQVHSKNSLIAFMCFKLQQITVHISMQLIWITVKVRFIYTLYDFCGSVCFVWNAKWFFWSRECRLSVWEKWFALTREEFLYKRAIFKLCVCVSMSRWISMTRFELMEHKLRLNCLYVTNWFRAVVQI